MTRPHESYRPAASERNARPHGKARPAQWVGATGQHRYAAALATASHAHAEHSRAGSVADVLHLDDLLRARDAHPDLRGVANQQHVALAQGEPSVARSTQPSPESHARVGTVVSLVEFFMKRSGTDGRKRTSPLKRAKDALLMALGQDDGDDYECSHG